MLTQIKYHFLALLVVLSLVTACKKGKRNPEACNGDTRRELKVMIDADAQRVNMQVQSIGLTDFGKIEVPEVKNETPRQNPELQLYEVRALVDKVDKKFDGDYHIRLVDGDKYLIAECPNPGCSYAKQSVYLERYKEVKYFIENNDLEGKMITVVGVAFIDIDHHYKRKQAANNMELHPIISIRF